LIWFMISPSHWAGVDDRIFKLGLSPTTLQAVADTGYTTATPIQAAGHSRGPRRPDVLGIAQTGTGKTAAFTLPMIDRLPRAAPRRACRAPW
jgi:superfamily II DNA/RNA helicase